jgi:AcrR family transcriptional regulator
MDRVQINGPPAPEGLRRDQLARRQRIVRAALRRLANNDYERVKIAEVARDSGVALGTVYRYFASKEHLFAAAFMEWQQSLMVKLEVSAPADDSEADRLRAIFRQVVRAFQLQPQFYQVLIVLQSTTDSYAREIFNSVSLTFDEIVSAAFEGELDADRRAVIRTMGAVLDGALRNWVMDRSGINEVYANVEDTIRLIYEYPAERPQGPLTAESAEVSRQA